jgi:hypothetical protein
MEPYLNSEAEEDGEKECQAAGSASGLPNF